MCVTCIVNKKIQLGFRLQESFGKKTHRFQAAQIELHVHYISTPSHLFGERGKKAYLLLNLLLNGPLKVNRSVFTFLISLMVASAFCWFLQARITLAPRPARAIAVAFPIPVLPPEEGMNHQSL